MDSTTTPARPTAAVRAVISGYHEVLREMFKACEDRLNTHHAIRDWRKKRTEFESLLQSIHPEAVAAQHKHSHDYGAAIDRAEQSFASKATEHLGPHAPAEAAIATLKGLGYTHEGGVQWKPPLGKQPIPIHEAYNALKRELQENEGYAWTFLSNVAMPLKDACKFTDGAANTAAGILIRHLFDYDVTKHPAWANHMARSASTVEANRDAQNEKTLASLAELAKQAPRFCGFDLGTEVPPPESAERAALRDTLMQIAMPELAARVASDPDRTQTIADSMREAIDILTGIPKVTGPSEPVSVTIVGAAELGATDGGRNEAFEGLHEGETLHSRAMRLHAQGWSSSRINETERRLKEPRAEVSGKSLQVDSTTVAEAVLAELTALTALVHPTMATVSRQDVLNRVGAIRELIAPAAPDLSPEYVEALKASKTSDFQQEFTVHFDRAESSLVRPIDPSKETELQYDERGEMLTGDNSPAPGKAIEPTVGRKVWMWFADDAHTALGFADVKTYDGQPVDATIVFIGKQVGDYAYVTVSYTDHVGTTRSASHVPLRQPGQRRPEARAWVEWMPYQVKTAGKA